MKSSEIRNQFLDYFKGKGHAIVASSPLVPGNDPTLLFTNSGMVQFKEVFLGQEQRNYVRATTSQRCVRAGGKHNDLENVGYTARHHTFFEMLGNFSFGDYFKRDAIHFAWELLTAVYKLPRDRLWVTVYETDDEAYNLWANEIRVPRERIARIGDKPGGAKYQSDNFWQMGETGPCGPCTEIFYDHGPEVAGGPPGTPEAEGDRYIEIWNLVFMQFNRDEHGRLHPLPKPSVDTGMGLERIAAILQGVHSNYDIDIFRDLIRAAERETKFPKILDAEGQIYSEKQKLFSRSSLNVIADHVRACAFLIVDGVIPGNEGRGYVLRRIIRRAIRHGYRLGQKQPFFHKLVPDLVKTMGDAYPELAAARERVAQVLAQEEVRFADTLDNGMAVLEGALRSEDRMLDGDTVFRLYDTYGFPLDLTADIARERGVTVDFAGFEAAMGQQRERARASNRFTLPMLRLNATGGSLPKTEFVGYDTLTLEAKIVAIYKQGTAVPAIEAGDSAVIVLDRTPFYAEAG
ncbi:MAG: alanine--tRNA ligase, partial [Betaproteobacteria bacterium]|nr:alanine--tRNA ligase [Betaproteobacteria bacterium]